MPSSESERPVETVTAIPPIPGEPAPPPLPRRVGNYEVLGELGRGGMGVVVQARDAERGTLVAIKLLREGPRGPDQVGRFRREAAVLSKLQHPNVVRLVEVGQHDGCPFLVMELVTGGTLEQALRAGRPAPAKAAATAEVLARALSPAHEAGVVHRDLKPSNVLVTGEGVLKLSDFGLAKVADNELSQTSTGAVLGTPSYMAPEQASGRAREVGPATDVWALGVMLYEMLTGVLPFRGPDALQTLQLISHADPAPPRQVEPAVPRDLETICLKCLEKEPRKRYASAAELADDLRRFQEDRPIRARPVGLRERAAKWRRRNPVTAALGLVFAGLALAGAAAWLWHWDRNHRVKVEYYANVVKRFGVAEGVGQLAEWEWRGRRFSFRFHRRGGRVERVDAVNGSGHLTGNHDLAALLDREEASGWSNPASKECQFTYEYNQKGELVEERALDRNGNEVWVLHYTSPALAQYSRVVRAGKEARPGLLSGLPEVRTRTGAVFVRFEWTAEGWRRLTTYLDSAGRPVLDDSGVATVRREYDERGCMVEWAGFGIDGRPCLDTDGTARVTKRHDGRGNVLEWTGYGLDGRPCFDRDGVSRYVRTFDQRGNLTEEAHFGPDGKPCRSKQGIARLARRHDERGNLAEEAYFGPGGSRCVDSDGYAIARMRHDAAGNVVEASYFDAEGSPCLNRAGNARYVKRYDDRGNEVEVAYFGVDGRPRLTTFGVARVVRGYDPRGNLAEASYFGTDGRPCLNKEKFARNTLTYDDQGNPVEVRYFGTDGRPCLRHNGVAGFFKRYDERGNMVEWTCFGVDGRPCLDNDGVARVTKRYDERGNVVEWANFGFDGQPCLDNDGFARVARRFDGRGNVLELAFFGVGGAPAARPDGVSRMTKRYDGRGNLVEWAGFGVDGRPCLDRDGVARITKRYDERDNMVEWVNFGLDGRPCLDSDGVCKIVLRYDEADDVVQRERFGVHGEPLRPGVVVTKVDPGTQAERAGLRAGDVLLRYDGRPVSKADPFLEARGREKPADEPRPLVVRRAGKTFTAQLSPGPLGCRLKDVFLPTSADP